MPYRSINPATGEVLKTFTEHTDADMLATLDAGVRASQAGVWQHYASRSTVRRWALQTKSGMERCPRPACDTRNGVFQPLLYQVATSVLAPEQIASPIRSLLARQHDTSVILGDVTNVEPALKQVIVNSDEKIGLRISYDYLILATGASHSYFGHDEFAAFAPGLKSLSDAEVLRKQILRVFEMAEIEEDPDRQKALMTFGMV
jgi:hypothetical protein